ncbi:DUF6302 family protein [Streptomyces lydicus]|uniref:DUF6302 family protein n=1 Tax=Streptomyces lydicus TaxID=47763 RepID=UPI00379706C0
MSAHMAPAPRLIPPKAAYDYEQWARYLVHPELLSDSMAVALFRAPLFAVPTGVSRQSSQLHMVEEFFARQIAMALAALPGFAQLSHSGPSSD